MFWMKVMKSPLNIAVALALALAFLSIPMRQIRAEDEYSFKVHNTTKDKITKLLASEDGKEYGSFDVGRAGIPPGETVTLKWDKSTNKSSCNWFIKAVFDDGSETPAKKFEFCEEDLELEF
jgi:hypothetical protein